MWTFFFPISMWWGVTYLHCIKDYLMIRFKYIYAFCTLEPHVKRGGFRNHGGKENSWSKIYIHIFLWIIYLGNQWISNKIYRKICLRYIACFYRLLIQFLIAMIICNIWWNSFRHWLMIIRFQVPSMNIMHQKIRACRQNATK